MKIKSFNIGDRVTNGKSEMDVVRVVNSETGQTVFCVANALQNFIGVVKILKDENGTLSTECEAMGKSFDAEKLTIVPTIDRDRALFFISAKMAARPSFHTKVDRRLTSYDKHATVMLTPAVVETVAQSGPMGAEAAAPATKKSKKAATPAAESTTEVAPLTKRAKKIAEAPSVPLPETVTESEVAVS